MGSYRNIEGRILDIRQDKTDPSIATSIRDDLISSLSGVGQGEKYMPEMLLWDEKGHKLFEKVNARPEYYVHHDELALLEKHKEEVVEQLEPGAMIIELGSGDLTKVGILLSAFESACQPLHYYALDLGLPNLRRTLSLLPEYTHVTVHGLYGTFDDGLRWISTLGSADSNHIDISSPPPQKLLLSLGATLGNISRDGCADFLSRFASTLDEKDLMLVSLDGTQDPALISNAYNDSEDINRAFNSNALDHANMVLGGEIFKDGEWETVGTWNKQQGRHEWGYRFRGGDNQNDWKWDGLRVKKGEKILGILSWNYDERQCGELWGQSGMRCIRRIGVEGRGEKGPKHYVLGSSC